MRSIVKAFVLMVVVTSPAWAHDPSCSVVYSNTVTNEGVPVGVLDGDIVLDDVHTSVGQSVLCAVDVRGRTFGPGVLSLYVYKGSPADDPPTTLLVGPIDMVNPPVTSMSQTLHYELPPTLVGQDLWIGVGWTGADGAWVGSQRTTASIGTSHDVWWYSTPDGSGFSDQGSYTASTFLVVYATVPDPTNVATWGALKATYR